VLLFLPLTAYPFDSEEHQIMSFWDSLGQDSDTRLWGVVICHSPHLSGGDAEKPTERAILHNKTLDTVVIKNFYYYYYYYYYYLFVSFFISHFSKQHFLKLFSNNILTIYNTNLTNRTRWNGK